MFCDKCGSTLDANGVCPVCSGNEATTVLNENTVVEPTPVEPAKDPGKVMGIVSLILGIVGVLLGSICTCLGGLCLGSVPSIGAIVGIVMGALGMKKSKEAGFKNTLATVGLILSIVAIVIIFVITVVNAIMGGVMAAEAANSSYYYY